MNEIYSFLKRFSRFTKNSDVVVAIALICTLVVMLIPVPALLIDMFLTMSFAISLLILLVSIYTNKPLEFSVFPSLLLMTTLFRLSLNVASTRRILVHGHEGTDAAGGLIHAFGSFVVGDNYIVGMIIFIILVVINFVVITKGSGRVAEVAARFTLDAMPGKQMSIDADLNAGLINDEEARRRRKAIESEADFYGAMDGASKFVRGDAIAGILITLVNIIGGLLIGVIQRSMDVAHAAKTYTMLTIGEGLVAQIPALIISTAAGIVVTRASSDKNLGNEVAGQLFVHPKAIAILSAILGFFGMISGMPKIPFFTFAFLGVGVAWFMTRYQKEEEVEKKKKAEQAALKPEKEKIESLLPLDMLELEVGYALINIVDSDQSGDLLERIVSIRKQFAMDLGIVVPSVHIRDNLQLQPGEYQIMIKGVKVAGGSLMAEHLLAMDPGNITKPVEGLETVEPAFGLPALWVTKAQKEEAELAGYTVVDLPTVMATHLTEIIRLHAHELLGRQEAQRLIENFQKTHPKVVEELIPNLLPLGSVVKVLQNLLREQVSIRDLLTIFETLADEAPKSKDSELLTESVRKALSRGITKKYTNEEGQIPVLSLDRRVEEAISNSLLQTEQGVQLVLDPQYAQQVLNTLSKSIENNPVVAAQPILLTSPTIRRHLRKLTERFIPQLVVLSHHELIPTANVKSVEVVRMRDAS
ncbi:MAG: flagellar biosynthesis protein FlhA [Oligoflexia bacterium]|nr:flagellar biosynthesis protein FlhA [Oligoflexia bacterium]